MRSRIRRPLWVSLLVAAALSGTLAGCATTQSATGAGDAASTSTGARSSPPRASASPSPELPSAWASAQGTATQQAAAQAALTAYQGMWSDLTRLGATSDWKNPELGRYMTGDVLSSWSTTLAQNKRLGLVLRGSTKDEPRVLSVSPADQPTHVEIADCVDDTRWLQYSAATGKLANNSPGGRHRSEALVTYDAGWQRWLVSQQMIGEVGSC